MKCFKHFLKPMLPMGSIVHLTKLYFKDFRRMQLEMNLFHDCSSTHGQVQFFMKNILNFVNLSNVTIPLSVEMV